MNIIERIQYAWPRVSKTRKIVLGVLVGASLLFMVGTLTGILDFGSDPVSEIVVEQE